MAILWLYSEQLHELFISDYLFGCQGDVCACKPLETKVLCTYKRHSSDSAGSHISAQLLPLPLTYRDPPFHTTAQHHIFDFCVNVALGFS